MLLSSILGLVSGRNLDLIEKKLQVITKIIGKNYYLIGIPHW